jgi:DNA-binding CsgD family transcriptional regulator
MPIALQTACERHKALLERAEEAAHLGSWSWSPRTDELVWSDNLFRIFGLDPREVTPTPALVVERTHPEDRFEIERAIEAGRRPGTVAPFDFRVVGPQGAIRHLRAPVGTGELRLSPEPCRDGLVQDVTEQRRAEREIAAHVAVSRALAAWDSLEHGAERLLRELATALEFSVAALWLPDGDALTARVFWAAPSADPAEFEQASRRLRLPRGIGLPGRAWQRRAPVDVAELIAENGFLRHEVAGRAGFRAALALPALAGDEVLAVVELFSTEDRELTPRLTRSLSGVGRAVGAFLSRRRGELKPVPLTPRELQVLQLAANGLSGGEIAERLVLSPGTIRTHFEHIREKLGVASRAAAVAHGLREGLIE